MKRLVLLVAVVASACGGPFYPDAPQQGTSCRKDVDLAPECVSASRVAYCEDGKWKDFACPSDCRNLQNVRCDWTQVAVGQPCPKLLDQRSFCSSTDRATVCKGGVWTDVGCTCDQGPAVIFRASCQ